MGCYILKSDLYLKRLLEATWFNSVSRDKYRSKFHSIIKFRPTYLQFGLWKTWVVVCYNQIHI